MTNVRSLEVARTGLDMPLVSVVIPAYNAKKYVLEAIRSIDVQAYSPVEILLIDDGSTDGTADLVEHQAPHVRVIRQQNAGAAAARNMGLSVARGEMVCFLDADDGWFPGKLAAQVGYLIGHPDVDVVCHKWQALFPSTDGSYLPPTPPEDAEPDAIIPEQSGWVYTKLLAGCIVHTSTVLMRKKVTDTLGHFRTDLVLGEDYDYWLRVSREYQIYKLARTYSYYRQTPGSLTNTRKPFPECYEYRVLMNTIDCFGVTDQHGNSLSSSILSKRQNKILFDFGYSHFHNGDPKIACKAFSLAAKHNIAHWRTWVFLLLSYLNVSWHSLKH
jgi:glycosyltransferase involved in cell wall biosynthesis